MRRRGGKCGTDKRTNGTPRLKMRQIRAVFCIIKNLEAKGSCRSIWPKGNGINTWDTNDQLVPVACAGYDDEDMHRSFMP